MSEGSFEPGPSAPGPGELSELQSEAAAIVARLLTGKRELFASLASEPVDDLRKLLFAGSARSGGDELAELPELEDLEDLEDEPDEFVADDEDIESIMSELLRANPEFALVEEPERREIVIGVINEVLAEGL